MEQAMVVDKYPPQEYMSEESLTSTSHSSTPLISTSDGGPFHMTIKGMPKEYTQASIHPNITVQHWLMEKTG